ncbi:hypothetical protein FDP41_009848 [Naegleria fowleri]|uniref:Cilia- and flagella-associated protein 206 n=1 Tax=Naegleria fowleri TaxID=5763 RepID=A0A6A5BBX4_NAEFO|nr:uncharacterized protein FDP41_009848 [Naegleria fowleri]KAF0971625.1 hypothetical protein FDP41_009848 [Naegleria fowleri]CAG4709447.1 unnamed protein product [Naegleria fowleri]
MSSRGSSVQSTTSSTRSRASHHQVTQDEKNKQSHAIGEDPNFTTSGAETDYSETASTTDVSTDKENAIRTRTSSPESNHSGKVLNKQFSNNDNYSLATSENSKEETKVHDLPRPKSNKFAKEVEIQTETHPIESYIDPKYEFSQWKLRKNVVQAADLRNKKDSKAQTIQSHFRRDNDCQVYLKKEKDTQTPKETGTNPTKHTRYIKGLRGNKDAKMTVVELKFDQN